MVRAPDLMKPLPALALGMLGVIVVTAALVPFRGGITRAASALLLMIPVIIAGILGGRLVLTNLLENAARLTPPGGCVAVVVTAGPPLTMSVSDEGPGFTAEMLAQAFAPFTSSRGGRTSGIGLSVCRSIVEAHGGTITAANRSQRGARLTIEVPYDG